ncbi:MAG: YbhB/YbcL family Raf kinase inhibitor-like protein, partial [Phycisphaerae bacterium]|nr:YbhB/YbcL family Raf kinase inhibitor-like protein [Phycisphaerae bacterium]
MRILCWLTIMILAVVLLVPVGCEDKTTEKETAMITVKSSAFDAGERIAKQYTGEGKNVSPPLSWTGV